MKKLYTLLLFTFAFTVNAQIVNIPDANFKAKLLSAIPDNMVASTETPVYNESTQNFDVGSFHTIDTNGDGEIQVSEAQAIKYLKVSASDISNLTGIEAFTNLVSLSCFYNELTALDVTQNTQLQYLYCDNNQLTALDVTQNTQLQYLYCDNNQLIALDVAQNTQLQYLNCYVNQLTVLDVTQNTQLQYLGCYSNQLTALDVTQNTQLQYLNCSSNPLTALDVTQNTQLQYLGCYSNQLTALDVAQNTQLQYLYCYSNQLTALDVSQSTQLLKLYCISNQLTALDISQNTQLLELNCNINQITALDVTQNTQLKNLDCSSNSLTTLDVTQNTQLQYLYCDNNQLTALDVTQNTQLQDLYCDNNQLTALDLTQNIQLQRLYCFSNQLSSLFIKSTNIWWSFFDFYDNPNLQYICTNEENLFIVQLKINSYGYASTCHVNSYCSFTPGGTFYTIEGNNHFDGNANGCDANDFSYPYLKFNVTDGDANGNFIANETGAYLYFVDAATYTLTPQLENPSYFNISPTSATIDFPAQASPFLQNFCITPNGVHHDLEIVIIPIDVARPGFDASYKIMYKNKGNQLENPTLTFAFDDAVMDFLNASVVPNNQDSGLLSWNLEPLAPLHSGTINLNFNLNSPMEIPALNSGDILNYNATISDVIIDETPANNVFTLNQEVVNSYDPNDKTCLEGETINPDQIGEFVHYQIRFENTGTYPAQNVVVKDMINGAKFDISTLQVINTSHSCVTKITGNKVEFIFENINLPFEDDTNDGYIVFKIKTKPTLTINSTISNSASIYFDYNFPIITNTATSTYQVLANPSFNFEKEFTLHPNPVKNLLNIRAKNSLEIQSLEVYNTLGQLVIAKPNFEQTLDVSNLKTGTYFVKINTEKGSGNVKFVKE